MGQRRTEHRFRNVRNRRRRQHEAAVARHACEIYDAMQADPLRGRSVVDVRASLANEHMHDLFNGFLRDAGLEHLSDDARDSLRAFLEDFSRRHRDELKQMLGGSERDDLGARFLKYAGSVPKSVNLEF